MYRGSPDRGMVQRPTASRHNMATPRRALLDRWLSSVHTRLIMSTNPKPLAGYDPTGDVPTQPWHRCSGTGTAPAGCSPSTARQAWPHRPRRTARCCRHAPRTPTRPRLGGDDQPMPRTPRVGIGDLYHRVFGLAADIGVGPEGISPIGTGRPAPPLPPIAQIDRSGRGSERRSTRLRSSAATSGNSAGSSGRSATVTYPAPATDWRTADW